MNLPKDFNGEFVVEESYYETNGKRHASPHLFLITEKEDGIWEGGSTSQFSPVMTFKLWEKFSDSCLEVSESMEVNGKKTFGYDEPSTRSPRFGYEQQFSRSTPGTFFGVVEKE